MEIKTLRFNSSHVPDRVAWINDPRVHNYMYFDVPVTLDGTYAWSEKVKSDSSRIDVVFLVDDSPAAMGGLTGIDYRHRNAELYVMVNPNRQGSGLGQIATKWLVNYGFKSLSLNRIYLETDSTNQPAIYIYNKVGFSLEGIAREHRFREGRFVDRISFGLIRTNWEHLEWASLASDLDRT